MVDEEVVTIPLDRSGFTVKGLEVSVCEVAPSLSVTYTDTV
jgi:hypothetical protein